MLCQRPERLFELALASDRMYMLEDEDEKVGGMLDGEDPDLPSRPSDD